MIRPSVMGLVLSRAKMSWEAHLFVSWFGPRGLNSLLLTLLVVHAGSPGAELLLVTVVLVSLASVSIQGATAIPSSAWYFRRVLASTHTEERESTSVGILEGGRDEVLVVAAAQLDQMLRSPNPPLVLDVRSRSNFDREDYGISRERAGIVRPGTGVGPLSRTERGRSSPTVAERTRQQGPVWCRSFESWGSTFQSYWVKPTAGPPNFL